ncbi:hypothetical protein BGZ47_000675 [Haplosporangium gracile]|nr:hypothetical protein BGZ47_000675 [Haplosporangium gracile]
MYEDPHRLRALDDYYGNNYYKDATDKLKLAGLLLLSLPDDQNITNLLRKRVQSPVILISDISRYLAIVDCFKILSSVTFLLDRDFQGIFLRQQEDREGIMIQQLERTHLL